MEEKGYLSLVLHAHLPFVRHPEHDIFFEESWFYEGMIETYIPIVKMLNNLLNDKIDFKITISLSPTLMSMMQDKLLNEKLSKRLELLIELSEKEIKRTQNDLELNKLAYMYNNLYKEYYFIYKKTYKSNLLNAFIKLEQLPQTEMITCCATHGYLPLMQLYPKAVNAQVQIAVDYYNKVFKHKPKGIWLPECGYYPGLDNILKENDIKYCFLDTHGILFANPRPKYGIYNPYFCQSNVAVLGRDTETSKAVWSAEEGYPGDFYYREFYRDIGYDLDYEYIKPYLTSGEDRTNIGIKYYRITGKNNHKEYYMPEKARSKTIEHAENFIFNRTHQIKHLSEKLDRKPLVSAFYDAELFGHWWFEGVDWLEMVLRKSNSIQNIFKLTTPSEYLKLYNKFQVINPTYSSWGWKGYSEVWLEGSNDWIYPHLHMMAQRMQEMANKYTECNEKTQRALNHLSRELLLAQSSDWAFMMKTDACSYYASQRIKDHIDSFNKLYEMISEDKINENWLTTRTQQYNIFPDINYKIYKDD